MLDDNLKLEKYLIKKSSRHHYIPQFLIEGFTNKDGLVYIFDKKKNIILNKARPPKAIFFEKDRNTIEIRKAEESSVLEESIYSYIDNQTSKIVKQYQNKELSHIQFNNDDEAKLSLFFIFLYWRIPKSDFLSMVLLNRSEITFGDFNYIDVNILKEDPAFQKIFRAGLPLNTINEMIRDGKKGIKWVNLHEFDRDAYVLGDNPILYRQEPREFRELDDWDYLIALSSKRIYSSTNSALEKVNFVNSMFYNAKIIHQSVNYVVCGDLLILQKSVQYYEELKKRNLLQCPNELFFISLNK